MNTAEQNQRIRRGMTLKYLLSSDFEPRHWFIGTELYVIDVEEVK
ncbi:MAG: hypothetical protein SRB2_04239 [Desulfobacteraceae bacterium Eth-SRB2]|nr:MAG: hypothetical protein SRB2_04239 [Desulfobacteraceae bacterium Eth-SRB2]